MDDINATSFGQEARTESTQGLHSNYMGGEQAARGLLNTPDTFSGGLGNQAMSQAIRQKYAGGFQEAHNRLSLDTLKNAQGDHLKKLEVATQMAAQEQDMNFQKEMLRKKKAMANAMMRGQMVGAVLGIVGGVGGAYAGGPQGALAGSALGSGAGNVIGSS